MIVLYKTHMVRNGDPHMPEVYGVPLTQHGLGTLLVLHIGHVYNLVSFKQGEEKTKREKNANM